MTDTHDDTRDGPAFPPAPPASTPATAPAADWPTGWGSPPPVWSPSPASAMESSRRRPLAPMILAVTGILALGVAAGAGIVLWHDHNDDAGRATATIAVDASPVRQPTGSGSAVAVQVAKQLGPAVGTVVVTGGQGGQNALGSAFVISNAGGTSYLVTNRHVVEGASALRVLMPGGKNLQATVVGTDVLDDLAVVSVKDGGLPTAVFGQSSALEVGQEVIAIGSPLGNEGSVTSGVVSALHRTIQAGAQNGGSQETLQDVLQTDASINPGNSGGPLADANGRVIGVNVAVAGQGTNIGFSIPSDLARVVVDQLIKGQTVQHPFIGIGFADELQATESGKPFDGPGVLVTAVSSGTPASDAGVHEGDVITSIDGVTLDQGQTVGGVLQRHKVGDTIPVVVRRGSQHLDLKLTLVARPASAG